MQNILPPGLAGYVAAQQQGQHNTSNQIQQLGGLMSLQSQMQDAPLRRQLLEAQVRQATAGPQPKWQAVERYNESTGQKEKVLVDLNNPTNVLPLGGQEARPLSFQNLGNSVVGLDQFTGLPKTQPIPMGVSPNTTATLDQSDRHFNARLPLEQANAGANLSRLFYDTGMGPTTGGFSPAQIQASTAPAAPAAPLPASRTPTPANFPRVLPSEQAMRDAVAGRIQTAEQNGGAGMIPTANVVQGSQPPQARPLTPKQQAEKVAKTPERIQSLRKEFNDVQDVKNYKTVLPIIESARNAPDNPAGDLDLIYSVGKILDPTSVVREGEMNLVIKSGSPIQRFQGTVNYITSGRGRLPAGQRAELLAMLDGRVGQIKAGYDNAVSMYTKAAQAEGLPLDQIIQETGKQTFVPPGTNMKGWSIKPIGN